MGRNRIPTATQELKGAFKKDPQRGRARANEPKPNGPLGVAPDHFTDAQKKVWSELAAIAPVGVLTNADRWLVELACDLMDRRRRNEDIGVGGYSQLGKFLSMMGLSPVDRSKVSVPKQDEDDNPFSDFVN